MPRAGDAFLAGELPLTHDPLGRIDYHPKGPVVDLQAFVDAVTNFLNETIFPIVKNITGLDLSGPEEFFFSLASMVINGGTAVLGFVTALTQHIIDAVINAFTGGNGIGQPISLLKNVLSGVNQLAAAANTAAASAANFISNALGLVVHLVQGVLPSYAQPSDVLGDFESSVGTVYGTGLNAQISADNANVGVARLEGQAAAGDVPGGIYFSDTFDRTSTTTLGANYDVGASGAPTGSLQTEGNNAWWNVGGSGQGTRFARVTTPLLTQYQGIQLVLNSKIANLNLIDPHVRLVLRCNAARTSYVYVDIQYDEARVYKVISGSTTTLGAAVPLPTSSAAGDRWTFKAGTDVSDDEFVIYQNTSELPRFTDSGTLAGKGAGYEYGGFILVNGQLQVGFGNTVQDPPKVQSLTLYDRLPAS